MIPQINNIIDILKLLVGLIAIIVLIVLLVPWRSMFDGVLIAVLIIWIAIKFWLREGWHGIKRLFRKRRKFEDINDTHTFIWKTLSMCVLIFLGLLMVSIFVIAIKEQIQFEKMIKRDLEEQLHHHRIDKLNNRHISVDQVLAEIMDKV